MIELIYGSSKPVVTQNLDIEALPRGKVTRLLVELTHDALGAPVWVPVLAARGDRPGPVFGFTAAVHGNELNGIPVLQQLFQSLKVENLRGTLVAAIVANVPSYLREQRKFQDGVDLNHIMPGLSSGNESQVYASRLLDRIVRHFDYLIDLHTASFGRVNSLYVRADMMHPITAQMAYLQRPQIIVHNPASDHTLRGTAMEMGIPAITLEIGNPHRFQPKFIKRSLVGLRAVLAESEMLPKRPMSMGEPPILCESSSWLYTDIGGLLEVFPEVTDQVKQGESIARIKNVFGDLIREYSSPTDGIVIGRSVNPTAQTGSRIFHLGTLAPAEDHPFQKRRPWKSRERRKKQ